MFKKITFASPFSTSFQDGLKKMLALNVQIAQKYAGIFRSLKIMYVINLNTLAPTAGKNLGNENT
ncbi:hypothetical protein X975_02437, partial [Stegodyphus mimosarum]